MDYKTVTKYRLMSIKYQNYLVGYDKEMKKDDVIINKRLFLVFFKI